MSTVIHTINNNPRNIDNGAIVIFTSQSGGVSTIDTYLNSVPSGVFDYLEPKFDEVRYYSGDTAS